MSVPGMHARPNHDRGFTLIELILVMVILCTVLGMAGPSLRGFFSQRQVEDAAASIPELPAALMDKASDSVGAAVGIANSGQVPPEAAIPLAEAARDSFMDGWQVVAIILCAIFATGAVLSLRFDPHRSE